MKLSLLETHAVSDGILDNKDTKDVGR